MTAEQRSKMGGHDAGAVLRVHPHRTALDVFLDHTGQRERTAPTPEMRWGQLEEQPILDFSSEQSGRTYAFVFDYRDDPRHSWLRAKPDAVVVGESAIVSAKSVGFYNAKEWGDEDSDHVPEYAIIQEHVYMPVFDANKSYVLASIGGRPPREHVVAFDPELYGIICEATERFWKDHVLTGTPPPPDGSDKYEKFLRRKFPKDERTLRPATVDESEIAFCLQALARSHSQTEHAIALAKQKLMASIGPAPGIEGGFGQITWRTSKDRELTAWKGMAEHMRSAFGLSEDQWGALLNTFTTKTPGNRPLLLPRDWTKGGEE